MQSSFEVSEERLLAPRMLVEREDEAVDDEGRIDPEHRGIAVEPRVHGAPSERAQLLVIALEERDCLPRQTGGERSGKDHFFLVLQVRERDLTNKPVDLAKAIGIEHSVVADRADLGADLGELLGQASVIVMDVVEVHGCSPCRRTVLRARPLRPAIRQLRHESFKPLEVMNKLLFSGSVLLFAGRLYAGDSELAGTDGTATSWQSGEVLLVEVCDKREEGGAWDYSTCVRTLRQKTATLLCKRGDGTYRWSFQVGSEKSKLDQVTTCKSS